MAVRLRLRLPKTHSAPLKGPTSRRRLQACARASMPARIVEFDHAVAQASCAAGLRGNQLDKSGIAPAALNITTGALQAPLQTAIVQTKLLRDSVQAVNLGHVHRHRPQFWLNTTTGLAACAPDTELSTTCAKLWPASLACSISIVASISLAPHRVELGEEVSKNGRKFHASLPEGHAHSACRPPA